MIEQKAHLNGGESAPRSVFQNRANLFMRDAGKPLDELRHECAVFEVLE